MCLDNMDVKRGRMDEYAIIQGRYTYLLREVSADDVKDHLHQEGILDTNDLDKIISGETPKRKTEILLGILRSRRSAFSVFLGVLRKTGYEHVADELEKYRDEAEDSSGLPSSSKIRCKETKSKERVSHASISRRIWKCEDTIATSQEDISNPHTTTLLQKICSRKKEILITNARLQEQEQEVCAKIRSATATLKDEIDREEDKLNSFVKDKCSKLVDCNEDAIEKLNGLEKRVLHTRTSKERRNIEMELEEVEGKTEQVSLVFNEYKPMPITFGTVDIQSSSGKIYKGNTYWNTNQTQNLRLETEGRQTKNIQEIDMVKIENSMARTANLKYEFSSKLVDEDMDICGLTDITVMSDNTIVVTDGLYTCVKSFWFVRDKLCYSRLPLAEPPWQVTRISSTTVAVTVPSLKHIWILAVKPKLSFEKLLRTGKEYRGLVRMDNGDLAASAIHSYTPCIDIIDMHGNVKRRLYSAKTGPTLMDRLWYLGLTHEGDILASDISKTRLLCVSKEGKETIKATFSPEWEDCLEDPHGVCCDREGNVYLARSTTNEIWCLTADGLVVVGKISLSDGIPIRRPWGLCVNDDGWLYVAESDGMIKAFIIT